MRPPTPASSSTSIRSADAPGYPSWDNGVERIDGTIALGEKITVHAEINPGRAFPVKVTELTEPSAMTWRGGMPLGLFTGVRTFRLTPTADGGTEFVMREEYRGPMLPLIWRSMPDLGPAFEQFARGLTVEAESRR
jgi:hypothetical protein